MVFNLCVLTHTREYNAIRRIIHKRNVIPNGPVLNIPVWFIVHQWRRTTLASNHLDPLYFPTVLWLVGQ